MAGKGDAYRKVDQKKWDKNYKQIFRKRAGLAGPDRNSKTLTGLPARADEGVRK